MISRILQPTTNIINHTDDLKKAARSLAGDIHDEATNKFGPLKEMAREHVSDLRGRASDSLQTARGFFKDHPFAAVGIGVFAGLLLAAWATTRD